MLLSLYAVGIVAVIMKRQQKRRKKKSENLDSRMTKK